jgi:hypothetical protein
MRIGNLEEREGSLAVPLQGFRDCMQVRKAYAGSGLFTSHYRIAPPEIALLNSWARTGKDALELPILGPCKGMKQTASFLAQVGA